MTSDILMADLVYARELIKGGLSEPQIMTSLIARGVNPLQAAELMTDLRHGRDPKVKSHHAIGRTPLVPAPKPEAPDRTEDGPVPAPRPRRHRPSRIPWWAMILLVVFIWALWYAWLKTGAESSRELINHDKHALPEHPSKEIQR